MRPRRLRIRTLMIFVALVALGLGGGLAVLGVNEAQTRAACINNLRLIGLGLHSYQGAYDVLPAGTIGPTDLPPSRRLSWMVVLFHFLEQGLSLVVDTSSAWDAPANRSPKFLHTSTTGDPPPYTTPADDPVIFRCPAHAAQPAGRGPVAADYVGVAGLGPDAAELPSGHPRAGFFGYDRRIRLGDIKDGAATTMAVIETTESLGPWIAGGPPTVRGVDPARRPYIGPAHPFGGIHRGGAAVLFADGSARFVTDDIDPKVFEALATIAGGEALPAEWAGPLSH